MRAILLIIFGLLIGHLHASPLADTTEYLNVSHRLNLLCTTLYGENHPLTDYITSYRQLISHYGSLMKDISATPNASKESEAQTLRVTLNTIRDYALNMLNKYQMVTGQEIAPLATAPLPQEALTPGATPPLPIQPAPQSTPLTYNQALQQYIGAMQTLPQQHYPGLFGAQPSTRQEVFKEQVLLLIAGLVVIGVCTFIGRKMFGRDIDLSRSYLRRGQEAIRRVNMASDNITYNNGREPLPTGGTA